MADHIALMAMRYADDTIEDIEFLREDQQGTLVRATFRDDRGNTHTAETHDPEIIKDWYARAAIRRPIFVHCPELTQAKKDARVLKVDVFILPPDGTKN